MPANPELKTPLDAWSKTGGETLFLPHQRASDSRPAESRAELSMPADLRRQATQRLRLTALSYSGAFFFADLFPALLFGDLLHQLHNLARWVPGTISVILGLAVAAGGVEPAAHMGTAR